MELAQGEAADGTEIVVVIDAAGNETMVRKVLGVQEMDGSTRRKLMR